MRLLTTAAAAQAARPAPIGFFEHLFTLASAHPVATGVLLGLVLVAVHASGCPKCRRRHRRLRTSWGAGRAQARARLDRIGGRVEQK
jgi:hypothetical protein